jgi:hypothetical protein
LAGDELVAFAEARKDARYGEFPGLVQKSNQSDTCGRRFDEEKLIAEHAAGGSNANIGVGSACKSEIAP